MGEMYPTNEHEDQQEEWIDGCHPGVKHIPSDKSRANPVRDKPKYDDRKAGREEGNCGALGCLST